MNKLIITGHSQGLGKALAEHYLQQGWQVLGISRREWPQAPEHLQQCVLDLADSHRLQQALSGGILADFLSDADQWLLINNAAQVAPNALTGKAGLPPIASAVSLNILAPLLLCEEAIRVAPPAGLGGIVHISSGAGRKVYPGWSVYGASKAFVRQFSLNLRADLAGSGVRVSNIEPGLCGGTEFSNVRFKGDDERAAKLYENVEYIRPQDIADTVLWLYQRPAHVNVNSIEIMPVAQSFGPLPISR